MNRKEFVRICGILGISLPFASAASSCSNKGDNDPIETNEKVIIIGAGPAGMSAGHLLAQRGIDFEILEALPDYGGRIKHNKSFTNFPISLGAEWIHVERGILNEVVNDTSTNITTKTQGYDLQNDQSGYYDGSGLSLNPLGADFGDDFNDLKFVGSSWLDFFETYVLPSIQNKISYNTPITAIDYSGEQVSLTAQNGQTYSADRVIVTVPVKILQNGFINFTPPLPNDKQDAINNITIWSGFKAFFKFSSKFYPSWLSFPDSDERAGQVYYYDAAYAQDTSDHILGLFSTGDKAENYQSLTGDQQRDYILSELDVVFGNSIATNSYEKHLVQNWNEQPYANGAYITSHENWRRVRTLGESVNNKLYFAGDAYTDGEDWSSVHAAARSAKVAIEEIVG